MEKQRLFKMGMLEKNFLVKALCDAQKSSGSETSGEVQSLINKTVNAPKGKLYLSDTEFQYAAQSLMECATLICLRAEAAAGLTVFSQSS